MATVVDALVVSLGLDSKEFSEGVRQATTALKEFQKDAKTSIGGAVQGISQGMSAFRALMLTRMGWASIGGIREMAEEMTNTQFKTYRLAKAFNVNAQELMAWQKAVQVAGGSPEAFNKSIENMVANLRKVGIGLAGVRMSGFGLGLGLGISSFGNPLKTMESLARTLHGMDMGRALVIGQKLGIDRDTIYMLQQGGVGLLTLVQQMRELGSPTEEQLAKTRQLRMSMEVLNLTFQRVKEQLFSALSPAIAYVTAKLTDLGEWAKKHPKAIEYAFYGIATALGLATAGMTAFTIATLANPVMLIIMGIAVAVALLVVGIKALYDEWATGSGTVFRTLDPVVKLLKQVWDFVKADVIWRLAGAWAYWKVELEAVGDLLRLVVNLLTGNWDEAAKAFEKLIQNMMRMTKILINFVAGELGYLVGTIEKGIRDAITVGTSGDLKAILRNRLIGGPTGSVVAGAMDFFQSLTGNKGMVSAAAAPSGTPAKFVDVTIGSVVVTVPTDDPEAMGHATRSALETEFRDWGVSTLISQ